VLLFAGPNIDLRFLSSIVECNLLKFLKIWNSDYLNFSLPVISRFFMHNCSCNDAFKKVFCCH
jgi:hypothetical protein